MCSQQHFLQAKKDEKLNHFVILFVEGVWTFWSLHRVWEVQKNGVISSTLLAGEPQKRPCNKMSSSKLFSTLNSFWFELADGFDSKKSFNKYALAVIHEKLHAHTSPNSWSKCGYYCVCSGYDL